MAELGRKEAEQLIKEILTEYARKIRSAKKEEYIADVQPLFSPDIDAFYKLVKSEDMDFCIFNRLNDGGIRQLLVGCRKLAKCYELDSYGKIKDFTYEPESPKCRIASDSGGKYTAGGSYTFTLEGKAELGNKWYEPHSIAWSRIVSCGISTGRIPALGNTRKPPLKWTKLARSPTLTQGTGAFWSPRKAGTR